MRRTPDGVRGLKYNYDLCQAIYEGSHSGWGAWIEILLEMVWNLGVTVALRMGCVD